MLELPPDTPRIGVDEWVESVEGRRAAGPLAPVRRVFDRTPDAVRLLVFVGAVALVPVLTSDQYVLRVGVDTLIFALLAIGLNVVVGFAGLLDLGYVAFFGVGAYGYALLSSDHYGIHWPAELSVPLIVVATGVFGLLLGSSSWRLLGDYLAIVTLFFLQAFVVITTNGSNLSFLGLTGSTNLTGGPNGIPGLDPFEIFGLQIDSERGYFYLALVATGLVLTMLYLAIRSRTGRAWQALREDPLAAELMGMPVNRLKLLAFAFGRSLPEQLRRPSPDHDLRHADPRRRRKSQRCRARGDRGQRLARGTSGRQPGALAVPVGGVHHPRGQGATVAEACGGAWRPCRLRLRVSCRCRRGLAERYSR
jgi:ABC-type branched-subunit amino acid transport system permease subunit